MFGSEGLSKLVHYQSQGDLHLKRPYHYSTHFDHTGANGTILCEHPASRRPPYSTGYYMSLAGMVGTGLACVLSRRTHEEKWWLMNLVIVIGYFGSFKFHKSENGLIGHTSGIWCAGLGVLMSIGKLWAGAGSAKWNCRLAFLYAFQGWIDWGRLHQWVEHSNEIKRNVVTLRNTVVTSMWAEYIPSHEEPELVLMRRLHTADGVRY
jgi:hypothetical protein